MVATITSILTDNFHKQISVSFIEQIMFLSVNEVFSCLPLTMHCPGKSNFSTHIYKNPCILFLSAYEVCGLIPFKIVKLSFPSIFIPINS